MGRKKQQLPKYGTVNMNGIEYYRTRIEDADGKRVALYGKTPQELFEKVQDAKQQIKNAVFRKENPTVKEYCERWLVMQAANIRATTLADYRSKVNCYIIKPLGDKYISEITTDDVRMAMVPVAQKSASVYRTVHMLYKAIFESAFQSNITNNNPCDRVPAKGGKTPNERQALTDEQVSKLLKATKNLPPYVFIMIGLYAGLRREEILALQWDCVHLESKTPYISVQRAWHSEHNRPVISSDLKTKAARRDIPIPKNLVECLSKAKESANSNFVVANRDGGPLSYTQFRHLWRFVERRTTKERTYVRYINGNKLTRSVNPVLGKSASNNGSVIYSLDFHVTPHQLRHTYITNLIHASIDPKTVQYLAGHENSKITMDIYAKAKYNKPQQLSSIIERAFREEK